MAKALYTTGILLCLFIQGFAQTTLLRNKIETLLATKKATVGVSVLALESGDTLTINNNIHYPMQSVFKFHIALAMLNEVDKGKFSLSQKIMINKSDIVPGLYSPIHEKYPNGGVQLSLAEILTYTVAQSDNIGCDKMLQLLGGPAVVNDYIHKIGIKDIAIKSNERDMQKEWNVQFGNWTTATAATTLLQIFYNRKILSQKSHDFLWATLLATSTGKDRLKGLLPAGTAVAHKTGTSNTNDKGITAAINDIGIVTLPNGKHFAISVFVSNSKENEATNEKIIASISKMVWDYFITTKK